MTLRILPPRRPHISMDGQEAKSVSRAELDAAVQAEREACERIALSWIGPDGKDMDDGDDGLFQDGRNNAARGIAAEIHAQGEVDVLPAEGQP